MDRVSAPETVTSAIPWINSEIFGGADSLEAINGSSYQLDPTTAPTSVLEPILDDGRPEAATESSSLIGRPDIDTAMLDALRHATVSDHGFPGPGWVAPDQSQLERGQFERGQIERGQFEVVRQAPHHGDSTSGPVPPARRSDIDDAMLDALRHAIVSDPRFPDD